VSYDVAIVGGGPSGSALGMRLARMGRSVVILERAAEPAWHACGVFSSPATMAAIRDLGLDEVALRRVSRPIPAMRVEAPGGARFRLTYGDDDSLENPAVGFDRPGLDRHLLQMARAAGVEVRTRHSVASVDIEAGRVLARRPDGEERLTARIVVGADGIRSLVARSTDVRRTPPLSRRVGLTFHVADTDPEAIRDARMIVLDGAYCGLAPVPGGRVNVGIVLSSGPWRAMLARDGAAATARRVLEAIPVTSGDGKSASWADRPRCDELVGASPIGSSVSRRAGTRWLLVGDAAGFLDPFTGEGLHRALVSAELAATAIDAHLDRGAPLSVYDDAMRARFRVKDLATLLVQGFLARPSLFNYAARRLATRRKVRETMALVIGDLAPASQALDPRFLANLLVP
jgi:flavin-dependent dehydrogenase